MIADYFNLRSVNKKRELEKLNQKIRNCKKCNLWRRRKNVVPGEGPANAKMFFVAEAPGRMESIQGKPFVGPAGKFLDKLFDLSGIDRKNVFITGTLKCRPVIGNRNRKPEPKEIKACLPYLKKQIEIINPKRFILLGEVAFSIFFSKDAKRPKEKLKDFRGKWITLQQTQGRKGFFITYHPAAGLRFPKIKKILEKDFGKMKIQ